MYKHEFSTERFFSNFGPSDSVIRDLCRDAMLGLINRYQLQGKRVLSLGSGEGVEESWFVDSDCSLTLNDINLPVYPANCQGTGLVFYHGDAGAALEDLQDGQFDLLYVSSFHPDEIRRETIQTEFAARRSEDQAAHYVTWPEDQQPYVDTLYNALAKIKNGGLAIFQHYRGGVPVDSNPHYVDAVQRQFQRAGVELLEVYTFRRSTQHLLVVGHKGDAQSALEVSTSLKVRPEIRTFHGRYGDKDISTDVVKVFDLGNDQVRPAEVFKPSPVDLPSETAPIAKPEPAGFMPKL